MNKILLLLIFLICTCIVYAETPYVDLGVIKDDSLPFININHKLLYAFLDINNIFTNLNNTFLGTVYASNFCFLGGNCINITNTSNVTFSYYNITNNYILNITNNITVYNTTVYNVTNNITTYYNTTNNITTIYNITNNITNNYYSGNGTGESIWNNNTNYAYLRPEIPQAINTTKTCLNLNCSSYQLITNNETEVRISWY